LKKFRKAVVQPLVVGFLFPVPVYLAVLLLLKAMKSLGKLVQPFVRLLPESVPAETVISLLFVAMQGHYALGIRFERTRRSYAQRRTPLTTDPLMRPFRFFASLNSAAARSSSVNYWRTILGGLHRLVAETAVDAHLLRLMALHAAAHRDVAFAR